MKRELSPEAAPKAAPPPTATRARTYEVENSAEDTEAAAAAVNNRELTAEEAAMRDYAAFRIRQMEMRQTAVRGKGVGGSKGQGVLGAVSLGEGGELSSSAPSVLGAVSLGEGGELSSSAPSSTARGTAVKGGKGEGEPERSTPRSKPAIDEDDLRRARRRAGPRPPQGRRVRNGPEMVQFDPKKDGIYFIDGVRFSHWNGRHRRLRSPSDSETDTSDRYGGFWLCIGFAKTGACANGGPVF